jgi:hypothetical protein
MGQEDSEGIDAIDAIEIAMRALAEITEPGATSLRMRDPNCARYVASEAIAKLEARGIRSPRSWSRWSPVALDPGYTTATSEAVASGDKDATP